MEVNSSFKDDKKNGKYSCSGPWHRNNKDRLFDFYFFKAEKKT